MKEDSVIPIKTTDGNESSSSSLSPRGKSKLSQHYASTRSNDEKVVLGWQNISYSLLVKDTKTSTPFATRYKEKKILIDINGKVESGQLMSIMGASGSGKTSLLNVLAARCPFVSPNGAKLTGSIKVNGEERNDELFRRISAYCLQDDNLFAHLTVLETLTLGSHFYLPSTMPDEAKANLVDAVISELGLNKTRDTIIGDDKVRGISGGERKRASIAQQLLTDPAILFLDEPTSGLDSFQALSVMECMKDVALNGRIVVTVIHQPRSSIYNMFDRLMLLSEGKLMYSGTAIDAVNYFGSLGFHCPDAYNPADYFLDLLSIDTRTTESEKVTSETIKLIGIKWLEYSKDVIFIESNVSGGQEGIKLIGSGFDIDYKKIIRNSSLLAWRSFIEQTRDFKTILIKSTIISFFSLLIGGIFSNIGDDQESIQNRKGLLFFIPINLAFSTLIGVTNTFPKEKNVVNRERTANAYTTLPYLASKFLIEIPLTILPGLVYGCVVYWIVGLNPKTFGFFLLILMFETLVATALGLGVSSMANSVEGANAIAPPFLVIGILFGGYYINIKSLPIVANWIPYISLFRWTFQALCINEFKGLTFNCDGYDDESCIKTGEAALATLSFDGRSANWAVFGLAMLLLCYLTGTYFIIENNKQKFLKLNHVGNAIRMHIERNNIVEPEEIELIAIKEV